MAEQNIGAARVHLIVDASDFDSGINQARNTAASFGRDAEAAFNKSSDGVRRATARIADYIAALKSTDGPMERQLRQLARLGADESIIKALATAWSNVRNEIQQTADAMDEAQRINTAFDQHRSAMSQRDFNSLLGVGDNDAAAQARRRADAEAAILPMLQQEERAYEAIYNEALRINAARDEHNRLLAQQNFNNVLGVDTPRSGAYLAEQQRVVAALTQQFDQMDAAIDQAFAQDADIERFRQQLVNLQETAGKTHYELLQMRADRLGVGETFRPMIKAIQDQDKAMGHAGITAKQYEWAMRGLPAQITDIAVSLASGQPAYLVMLQQGGQLKDMFGGIGPAARAVGSAVWAMVNPWTIAAVAIGAAAYAAYDASRSMEQLAIAVAKGDQVAGTAEQMYALADALNEIDYVNLGSAEAAVARLASGGKLAGDNFRLAAEATARWAAVTGEDVDGVADKFEAIAKGPLEAIESGLIRVTESQKKHIEELVNAGQEQQAVNELTQIYYDKINDNTDMVESHLSGVSRYWKLIKDNIGEATRGLGDFINGFADFATRYEKSFQRMVASGRSGFIAQFAALYDVDFSDIEAYAATPFNPADSKQYDPEKAKRDKQRTDELARWNATADKAAQRQITLNKLEADGIKLGQSRAAIDAVLARQRKQWEEQDAKAARKGRQGRDGTQAIRDQAAAEIAAITTQTKLLQSQYDQRQITVEDYYTKLRSYADQELTVTLRSIDAQKIAVAGREDSATRIAELESQAARAREQNQQRAIELSEAERKAIQQREIAYRDYVRALDDSNKAAQRDADLAVARIGMGSVQYTRLVAINEVLRKRSELEAELDRRVADGNLEPGDAERYRDALEKVNEQIAIMVDGYRRVDEAQQSFFLGAQGAWQDWLEQTRDVASQGGDLMTSALEGFSSATADALNGNLESFDAFFENLHVQILNFIVRQQLTKWLESLGESASKAEGDGIIGNLLRGFGSLFGGGKKADTGAAALTASATALTGAATALTSAAVALGGAGVANGASTEGGGGWIGTASNVFSSLFTKNAKGGVYGGDSLAAYRNSIVSQPTVFPFAKGGVPRFGLMGEAGTEGIFPLARTASGDLGVRVVESRQVRGPVTINQPIYVQGTPDRSTREQLAKKAGRETSRAMART